MKLYIHILDNSIHNYLFVLFIFMGINKLTVDEQ